MTKKFAIIIALGLLCLYQGSYSQSVSPLAIGEKLPEKVWNTPLKLFRNGTIIATTLAEFKNRPIVLDFWASWCTNCLKKFNQLEQLQATHTELQVLLVNSKSSRDDSARVAGTLLGSKSASVKSSLPSVMLDEQLTMYFPHRYIPYMVWIDSQGMIRALTQSEFLDAEAITGLSRKGDAK